MSSGLLLVLGTAACSGTHAASTPSTVRPSFSSTTSTTLDAVDTGASALVTSNYAYCLNLSQESLGSSVTTTGCGTYDGADSAYDITLTQVSNLSGSSPTTLQDEYMQYGSTYYVKSGGTWYLSTAAQQVGFSPAVAAMAIFGLPSGVTPTSTTLASGPVREYSGTADLTQLANLVPVQFGSILAAAPQDGTANVSVYVGPKGHVDQLVESTQQTVSDQPVTDTTQITFSHFGQEPPIVPPPPQNVLTQPVQAGSGQTSSGSS